MGRGLEDPTAGLVLAVGGTGGGRVWGRVGFEGVWGDASVGVIVLHLWRQR